MNLYISAILLILGFLLLVKGSDLFVDGSASVARLMGIPAVIVGLTIVSIGTSAPEAAVSITAGINGSNEIAFSNLVGSNIFNMLMVAGLSAAISPFFVDKTIIKRDFPFCIAVMVIAMAMSMTDNVVSRLEGAILLAIFVAYIIYLVLGAIKSRETENNYEKPMSAFKSIIFIIIGIVAIILGGQLVVKSATFVAEKFGMSETLIGVTIVAIGTSLPELVTSVVAARKGQSEIAIGNVIGSNIFNIVFILGMSSMLNPIGIVKEAIIDSLIMVAITIIGYVFCLKGKKLNRSEGIIFVSLYIIYTIYLIMR